MAHYHILYSNSIKGCIGVFDKIQKLEYYQKYLMLNNLLKHNPKISDFGSDSENEEEYDDYTINSKYINSVIKNWDILNKEWYSSYEFILESTYIKNTEFYVLTEYWGFSSVVVKFIKMNFDLSKIKLVFEELKIKYSKENSITPTLTIQKHHLNQVSESPITILFWMKNILYEDE